ncbi:hypothetical protein Emag_001888 [Eimeria magna]
MFASSGRCSLCRAPPGALALLFELLSAADLHSLQLSCCLAATAFSPQLARERLQRDFGACGGVLLLSSTQDDATAPQAERPPPENEGSFCSTSTTHAANQGQKDGDCFCLLSCATEANTAASVYRQLCANRAENMLCLKALRYEQQCSSGNSGSSRANILRMATTSRDDMSSAYSGCSPPCAETTGFYRGVVKKPGNSRSCLEGEGLQGAFRFSSSVVGAVVCCARAATAGELAACRAVLSTEASAPQASATSAISAAGGACLMLESDHLIAPCIAPFVFSTQSNKSTTTATTAPPLLASGAPVGICAGPEETTQEALPVLGGARDIPQGVTPRSTQLEWHLFGCLVFPAPGEGTSALLIAIDATRRPTASTHALAQEEDMEAAGSASNKVLLLQQFLISSLRAQHLAAEIPLGDLPQITYCCCISRVTPQKPPQEIAQETVVAAWDRAARHFVVTQLRPAAQVFEQCEERGLNEHPQAFQQQQARLRNAAEMPVQQPEEDYLRGGQATASAAASSLPISSRWGFYPLPPSAYGVHPNPFRMQWVQPLCIGAPSLHQRVCVHALELPPLLVGFDDGSISMFRLPRMEEVKLLGPSRYIADAACVARAAPFTNYASLISHMICLTHAHDFSWFNARFLCFGCSTGSSHFSEFVEGRGVCTWGETLLLLQMECHCSKNSGSSSMSDLRVFLLSLYPIPLVAAAAMRAKKAAAGPAIATTGNAPSTSPETGGESKEAVPELQQALRPAAAVVCTVLKGSNSKTLTSICSHVVELEQRSLFCYFQISFNGKTATVTLRQPSCICFLDVHCKVQQHPHDKQEEQHGPHMRFGQEEDFELPIYLESIEVSAGRAGAFLISPGSACTEELARPSMKTTVAAASDLKGIRWLLQWGATPLSNTALALARSLRSPVPYEQFQTQPDQQPVRATLVMTCHVACCCPSEVGCVATDEQCCFFALEGSSQVFVLPMDWKATGRELLACIDTRAVNAPGPLGAPSLLSRAWLAGVNAERHVQQMALEKLCVAGPFLVAVRRHDRVQVLLLPLQCQQHFPPTHALEQRHDAVSARAEAGCTGS